MGFETSGVLTMNYRYDFFADELKRFNRDPGSVDVNALLNWAVAIQASIYKVQQRQNLKRLAKCAKANKPLTAA